MSLIENLNEIKRQKEEYIIPENIKKDIEVFGITGTLEEGSNYPPDWSGIDYTNTPQCIIDMFNYSKNIYDNWDNTITDMDTMFFTNDDLYIMPLVDTSNITSMNQTFYRCTNLMSVPLLDFSSVTLSNSTFEGCTSLKYIPLFDTSNLSQYGHLSMFHGCGNLTNDSLNNILRMCINAININPSYKTLNWLGLTSDQATICQTLSNYQDFLDAGWTTGY